MKLENRCLVPADLDTTWELITDIPRAAACVPGVKYIYPDGEKLYRASIQARVGPMGFTMSGTILVMEQDREKGEARFQVNASDRRLGGSIRADMTSPEDVKMLVFSTVQELGEVDILVNNAVNSTGGRVTVQS